MTSIGKIAAAIVSGSLETTIALANLNFDFSLVTVEAPAEFQGLGQSLSKGRKTNAEVGSSHVTARKLGALFEDGLPDVRSLLEAYGRRVTEIAQNPQFNPKGTLADGPFADLVGADGTTIWAAATSGKGAMCVLLLACMLARFWKAPEAISIWTELIIERKAALADRCSDQTFHLSTLAAAQIQLTREQLAEWDASARAWLRTADEAKRLQQTQLMLVLKNIGFPIAKTNGVYTSVMGVWTKAMTTLDKLIQGMPQSVQEGAVLLGLSAWHLYPDMLVEGHQRTEISQRDSLINQGGLITLGLASADPNQEDGIYWSLPLAHLRYYGDPITRSASAGDQSSRVSLDQLQQVALGSIIRAWGKFGMDLTMPMSLIHYLFNVAYPVTVERPRWVQVMAATVEKYLSYDPHTRERAELSRLVKLGIRKCPDFIAEKSSHPVAVFGLANVKTLISLCSIPDAKLACLRKIAELYDVDSNQRLLIRYRGDKEYCYTKFVLKHRRGTKRTRSGTSKADLDMHWTSDLDLFPDTFSSNFANSFAGGSLCAMCPPEINKRPVPHEFLLGDPDVAAVFRPMPRSKKSKDSFSNTIGLDQIMGVLKSQCINPSEIKRYLYNLAYSKQSPHYRYFDSLDALDEAKAIFGKLSNASVNLTITSRPLHSWQWRSAPRESQKPSLAHAFACIAAFETGDLDLDPLDISKAAVMALSYGNSMYVAERLLSDPLDILPPYAVRRIVGNIGRPGLSLLVPPESPRLPKPDFTSWKLVNHNAYDGQREDHFSGTSLHLSFSEYKLAVDIGSHGQRDQEACYVEVIVSVHDRGKWIADLDILRADRKWMSHAINVKSSTLASDVEPTEEVQNREQSEAPSSGIICSEAHKDDAPLPFERSNVSATAKASFLDSSLSDFLFDGYDGSFSEPSFGRSEPDWISDIEVRLRNGDGEYAFELPAPDEAYDTDAEKVLQHATVCQHVGDDRIDTSQLMPMVSIDSWAEFLDPPTMNAIVRAWDNKLGRLSLAAVAMQKGYNIHIVGKESCWKCDFEQCSTEEQHNARIKKASDTAGKAQSENTPEGSFHLFIC